MADQRYRFRSQVQTVTLAAGSVVIGIADYVSPWGQQTNSVAEIVLRISQIPPIGMAFVIASLGLLITSLLAWWNEGVILREHDMATINLFGAAARPILYDQILRVEPRPGVSLEPRTTWSL